MGVCKICQKEKKLIKRSHIISKLLFRDLFESQPRKYIIQLDLHNLNKPNRKSSDALYDNNLFCADCENGFMNIFEDYFKKYIVNPKSVMDSSGELRRIIYSQYDYDKFFLFFNIQIYRASLSQREEFKVVNLDEDIIEKIRINIMNQKIIKQTNEIAIVKFEENSNFKNMIGSFRRVGNNYYIILRDFIVFYFFDQDDINFLAMKGHLIKRDKVTISIIPKNYEDAFILSITQIKS